MTARALLVASQMFELTGCERDASLVRQVLEERGFSCTTLLTAEATRAGILAAFDELIAATGADDAAVFYYSGHGGRMPLSDWRERRAAGLPSHLQFLVPSDIEQSTEDDFRGLLGEELTAIQRRLTDRTRNVTTLLDCCHSAYMARDIELVPKATVRSFPVLGAEARLRSLPPLMPANGTDTNDIAVRVVACHPEESAYERDTNLFLGRHGVLTEALAYVLRDLGNREVSWAVIADIVRRRTITAAPQQRPEVEGPAGRLPFSLTVKARPHSLPVTVGKEVFIDGARLLGVSPGDTFRLQPAGGGDALATAVVERLDDQRAVLAVSGMSADTLPSALDAVPLTTAVPQLAVRLEVTGTSREILLADLEASSRLRPAEEAAEPVLATISGDGALVVRDVTGAPMHGGTLPDDEAGRRRALELIELLAKAERLRALGSGEGDAFLDVPVTIELARHGVEGREVIPLHGTQLFTGQPISVRISNGSNTPVYIWLFDVGVANTITLVTNDAPSGFRLGYSGTPGDTRTIGGTSGMPLSWPSGVPEDGPRMETLVIILSDRPQDLRGLESSPSGERGTFVSPLDAILDEVRRGAREWSSPEGAAPLRYRIERVDFLLDPRPEPDLTEPAFELDERPHLTLRMLQPRPSAPPPERVSVRLADLAIRPTGALSGAAVRVDTVVLTSDSSGGLVVSPRTMRFPHLPGADVLPVGDGPLYLGEVKEFVDLAIWVGPDGDRAKDLIDLFAEDIVSDPARTGLTVAAELLRLPAAMVPPAGTVAAAAMILRAAARLLRAATDAEVGVYRTSRLAFERFGLGRTPPSHRRQARDVEFAYEIVET